MLKGNAKGVDLLENGVKYCEAHSIYFFGVKYLLILILSNLCLNTEISCSHLNKYLNKALDWCVRYQINRSYWKSLFIKGKLYQKFKIENNEIISGIYIQSLEQFQLAIKNPQTEEYNLDYLMSITCFFRENGLLYDNGRLNNMLERLNNNEIKEQMIYIMKMNESE